MPAFSALLCARAGQGSRCSPAKSLTKNPSKPRVYHYAPYCTYLHDNIIHNNLSCPALPHVTQHCASQTGKSTTLARCMPHTTAPSEVTITSLARTSAVRTLLWLTSCCIHAGARRSGHACGSRPGQRQQSRAPPWPRHHTLCPALLAGNA